MPKYCASGLCKNNAKDNPSKKFALFVQTAGRNKDLQRAKRWVQLMGRANFSVEHIKSYIYVCEDHFDENVELDYRKNKDLEPYPPGYDRNKRKRLRRAENDNQDQTRCKIFGFFLLWFPQNERNILVLLR